MKKYEMLEKVIKLFNTCEIHSTSTHKFSETFVLYNTSGNDCQLVTEITISQYFDTGDGRIEAFGQVRNLSRFELLLLRGIIIANHSRILYF